MKSGKLLAGAVLAAILLIFLYYRTTGERTVAYVTDLTVTDSAESFHLSSGGSMVFDGALYILNRDGELIKTVSDEKVDYRAFFANNFAFLYDPKTGRVSQYKDTGEFIRTVTLNDTLFDVTYRDGTLLLHTVHDGGERLLSLGVQGGPEVLYETANAIVAFDLKDLKNFTVCELKVETNGYRTVVRHIQNGKSNNQEMTSEVALKCNYVGDELIVLTNKHIYHLGAQTTSVDIPNPSDMLVMDRNIYLLHSGILTKYNMNLKELQKNIVAANITHLQNISGSVYGYSKTDIAGNLMKADTFYFRLPKEMEAIEFQGLRIGTLEDGVVSIYEITDEEATRE
ncbi:hypothetical protein O6R05_02880 [Peptoniphilus equinus]|uniref:DUF5050 domain-containing protein n=1 Tax=Peptoniphilus equinus TaxID=3016343 RepID=A0ABY7QW61_9FIRM|nr:hypothetical protein [Peptoniphilus equinus]WBW50505.1 hypothetical protein O6R05_02880 [Peptoniphilus equinus]